MRRLIDYLLNLYLLPIRLNKRLLLYVKGILIRREEHFLITADVMRRNFPGDIGAIIDAGAFDGDSTVFFAREFPENPVIGFEPNPAPFGKAVQNTASFSNIKMENKGLSSFPGQCDFNVTNDHVSSSLFEVASTTEFSFAEKIRVELTTLDEYTTEIESILLLKMDVQGAELAILRGAANALAKTKLVLTEVLVSDLYKGGCKYYEVDQMLRQNSFRLYSIISNYNNKGTRYFDVLYIHSKFHDD